MEKAGKHNLVVRNILDQRNVFIVSISDCIIEINLISY